MTEKGFDNVETLTKNWRNGDCKKLTKILKGLRKMIRMEGGLHWSYTRDFFQKDFPYKNFQVIDGVGTATWKHFKMDEPNAYKKEDLIICAEGGSNNDNPKAMCNIYTKKFEGIPKFQVKNNTRDYCNGDIIFERVKGVKVEKRHGYTIHAIQGETAEHKLFIDMTKMKSLQMFYTALSRARSWKQIYLIKPSCKE